MQRPGIYEHDQTITANIDGTNAADVSTPHVDLDGVKAVTGSVRWAPAGGDGTSVVKAYLQTSLDKGQTYFDIGCATFSNVAGWKTSNLSGLTPVTSLYTPEDGALADNTVKDGLLGDRLRWKFKSSGTAFSAGSVASCRICAR